MAKKKGSGKGIHNDAEGMHAHIMNTQPRLVRGQRDAKNSSMMEAPVTKPKRNPPCPI